MKCAIGKEEAWTVKDQNLPLPPLEMRRLVGPEDPAAFDNPSGDLIFSFVPVENYRSVFDFGCGCGRIARQLMQQRCVPERYLGIDLHLGMVTWCKTKLTPIAPSFEFLHHDTQFIGFNSGPDKPHVKSFPIPSGYSTLAVAVSVFTHLIEDQAAFYLDEVARVLHSGGLFVATWFVFDKRDFPMMQEFQNALYINLASPGNAVIFDRDWIRRRAREAGLTITGVFAPSMRGSHWTVLMRLTSAGAAEAAWPPDLAPVGDLRPPLLPADSERIGLA